MDRAADTILELRYGSGVQRTALPSDWHHHRLRTAPSPAGRSEDEVIEAILAAPFGPSLTAFLNPDLPLLILVSDKTRRCQTGVFLPHLLAIVHAAGIPRERVSILFASGTHPAQSEAEKRAIIGDDIYDHYLVREHDARDEEACIAVGSTRFGTPVLINRMVADAAQVLATGTIVHHYFAGFGGGAKLFVPGVAAHSTAVANHRRTITAEGRFHPGCTDGAVEGNPVIEDIMDARRLMPPHWYFAALLDDHGRIADGVCGDMDAAHREGCRRVDARFRCTVENAADVTIVSAGGYPKDINFIQAHKALHHASYATREGGGIICLAECRDGIGNDRFMEWFAHKDESSFREALLHHYAMNAHTALAMREKARRHRIIFVSNLPAADVLAMGMEVAPSLEAAVDMLRNTTGQGSDVAVLENGSLTVPMLRENRA
ncbi:MAG: nickel-dependent lactate racemase [Bacteroidetes bacterium]|nr:nickel-dependent lactate racemase [Bacteroidota bacterium]